MTARPVAAKAGRAARAEGEGLRPESSPELVPAEVAVSAEPQAGLPAPALLQRLHGEARAWFTAHQRPLPWRLERSPWRVWVSEIMLQQTQVATVIPYFERFLARFPDAKTLAEAPQEEVLSLWRGLGYYSRARNLQRGAQVVTQQYDGHFPPRLSDALRIPGVGRYTAGAILSLAFQQPVSLLDGNVARVLSRLTGSTTSPKTPAGLKHYWTLADSLLDPLHPDVWNEALMELGATVCTPTRAQCTRCPLKEACCAAGLPDPTVLPVKSEKMARPAVDALGLLLRSDAGELLLARRPDEGLLGGMWELPGGSWNPALGLEQEARRLASHRLGLPITRVGAAVAVTHLFTHFRLELTVVEVAVPASLLRTCAARARMETAPGGRRRAGVDAVDAEWTALELFPPSRLQTLPIGKATLKALEDRRWAQLPLQLERTGER